MMERTELIKLLRSLKTDRWRFSNLRGNKKEVIRWLPVLDLLEKDLLPELSEQGYWVLLDPYGQIIQFSPGSSLIPLLPCLELNQSKLMNDCVARLQSLSLPIEVAESFSFNDVVICGLTINKDYWANLALQWLESMPLTPAMIDTLSAVVNAKWASQRARHSAKRNLKKIGV